MKLLTFILILINGLVEAKELKGKPPVGLLELPYNKISVGKPVVGPHGLTEFCYKLENTYVVYSQNLLGEGFSFLTEDPNKNCITPSNSRINKRNVLGLYVGLPQRKASNLLSLKLVEGSNEFVWQFEQEINETPYDNVTTLNITITNSLVYAVSIFNTVAN